MEFVTLEIAKKLKEKKFPQHWSNDDYIVENDYEDDFEVGSHYDRCFIPEHLPTIAAPTISQVLKWIREEKKIDILPQRGHISIDKNSKVTRYYNVNIYFERSFACTLDNDEQDYSTYEEAALAGIKYVLDNLI